MQVDEMYSKIKANFYGGEGALLFFLLPIMFLSLSKWCESVVVVVAGVPFHGFVDLFMEIAKRKYPNRPLDSAMNALVHYCQIQLKRHGVRSGRLRREEIQADDDKNDLNGSAGLHDVYLLPYRAAGAKWNKRHNSSGALLQ